MPSYISLTASRKSCCISNGVFSKEPLLAVNRSPWQFINACNFVYSVPFEVIHSFTRFIGIKSLQTQIPYLSCIVYDPSGAVYPLRRIIGLYSYFTFVPST